MLSDLAKGLPSGNDIYNVIRLWVALLAGCGLAGVGLGAGLMWLLMSAAQ